MSIDRKKTLLTAINEILGKDLDENRLKILYYMLDVVDTKASTLLTFNSVIIASFALLANSDMNPTPSWIFHAGMLAPILACVSCFRIVSIDWPFLGKRTIKEEYEHLAERVDERTSKYRCSFKLSFLSVAILAVMLGYSLLCHFRHLY